MAASYAPDPGRTRLVLLLLGERRSGKSSAGNAILGRAAFHRKTRRCSLQDGNVFGKQVSVVDTPGWRSDSAPPDQVTAELMRGVALCRHRPDAVLLVLPATASLTQEGGGAMQAQLRLLQVPLWQRALVLFTHGDQLGNQTIEDHIRRQGQALRWLLVRCRNRYQVLSSRAGGAQVLELLEKIQEMVAAVSRRPDDPQRSYTTVRPELRLRGETRPQGAEQLEMTAVYGERRRHTADPRPELFLVLLGRRRSGKSLAGNVILGRAAFRVGVRTSACSAGRGEAGGRPLTVVDTPGWSLFGLARPRRVRAELARSSALRPPGAKAAALLVVPLDSFGVKDRDAAEEYLGVLGAAVWGVTVVVFTYGDELRGGATLEQLIQLRGQHLQQLLHRCGHRYCLLDSERHVAALLDMVHRL